MAPQSAELEGARNLFKNDREQELLKAVLLLGQATCVTVLPALLALFKTGLWILKKKKPNKQAQNPHLPRVKEKCNLNKIYLFYIFI